MNTIHEAIEDIRKGNMVIVVDDESRENEGDLVMAAEKVTPQAINFMAKHARGLICMPISHEIAARLKLPKMVEQENGYSGCKFTVSVDARHGISTGISAADRAATIMAIISAAAKPEDLVRPGHTFPLIANPEGVIGRPGHTESAVDLAKMAGLRPAGVICEVMNDDGTMARLPELEKFAKGYGLKIITIEALISYRNERQDKVKREVSVRLPTEYGIFNLVAYSSSSGKEHIALLKGDINAGMFARVHSNCLTGDVFHSLRCDCMAQLDASLRHIGREGGILIYLDQEGRGIGLLNKLKAYKLQDMGLDTVEANRKLGFEADMRDYNAAAMILKDLGIHEVRLMTNNPKKIEGLQKNGINVLERMPLQAAANSHNKSYLSAKKEKLGHLL